MPAMTIADRDQLTVDYWHKFLFWLLPQAATDAREQGLTDDLILSLYLPAVSTDDFWERVGAVMRAYRNLPGAMIRLQDELRRLSVSNYSTTQYLYTSTFSRNSDINDFLLGIRWYQNSAMHNDEYGTGHEIYQFLLKMLVTINMAKAGESVHPLNRDLVQWVMFWERMCISVKAGKAVLIEGRQHKTSTSPIVLIP